MSDRTVGEEVADEDSDSELQEACVKFVRWLSARVVRSGRGDDLRSLEVEPSGSFWLGRLAPEEEVIERSLGERGERLDPCAVGMRLRPEGDAPYRFDVRVEFCVWVRGDDKIWTKTEKVDEVIDVEVPSGSELLACGRSQLTTAVDAVSGVPGFSAEIRVEQENDPSVGAVLTIELVNTSGTTEADLRDTNLYEAAITVSSLDTVAFELAALPDSFRFDRGVPAYGINCGVEAVDGGWRTADALIVDRGRPTYWASDLVQPDLRFGTLEHEPIPELTRLVNAVEAWGAENWGPTRLASRKEAESWSEEMAEEARIAALDFASELSRIRDGLELLVSDPQLLLAFKLMNGAMSHAARGKYVGWRAFQVGFLLANLASLMPGTSERTIVDIVWFATGGGKTETYLGLLVMAALFDRMRGKDTGVTAWSRFPLRMLSLQQTQRFADAMAGAELARRGAKLGGDPFAVGFFVGRDATPNRIPVEPKEWEPDPEDDDMPSQYKVLMRCPFCGSTEIDMVFDRRDWCLRHVCLGDDCPWDGNGLPFYIVDEEIFRFLPTVVVGTLDKAASFGLQAAMRGLTGPPHGVCSEAGHGFLYARRSNRPNGCLVPGCTGTWLALSQQDDLFAPTFRLQDELHLLRDSLGAVDAHYEALIDALQVEATGVTAKVLASSATLSGFQRQADVLYQRPARVFPSQGPTSTAGFWSHETSRMAREFVGLAPRGVTGEYVSDRLLTELQGAVRLLVGQRDEVCNEIGVDPSMAPSLIDLYGVDVVYGNTLRDLDAVTRSLESQQVRVDGDLNFTSLTGRTPFEEVRETLRRLEVPEPEFAERIHVITASSMMSHGVDIDRLNVMVMIGIPLATAEFIQTTARVGRRLPGLVFVLHKIARERDASVFRSFTQFVTHGDRFVEAVPITRRSRRVLDRTISGLEQARILQVHEPRSATALTTASKLRDFVRLNGLTAVEESKEMGRFLGLVGPLDDLLSDDIEDWMDRFFQNLNDPAGTFRFTSDLFPTGSPMISLRDVEELAPVRDIT